MRAQVIDIFSEWLNYWLTEADGNNNVGSTYQAWWEANHSAELSDTKQVVFDCFENKPEAPCYWLEENNNINIIVKNPKQHKRQ